jgi:hypothetical protein
LRRITTCSPFGRVARRNSAAPGALDESAAAVVVAAAAVVVVVAAVVVVVAAVAVAALAVAAKQAPAPRGEATPASVQDPKAIETNSVDFTERAPH